MELRLTRRNARKKSNETDDAFPVRMERAFILVLLLSLSFPLKVVAGGPFRELFFLLQFGEFSGGEFSVKFVIFCRYF